MNWVIRTARGAAAALIVVSAAGCSGGEAEDIALAPGVAPVTRRDLDVKAEASGLIEPIRNVEVKSKASGEILKLHVETGDEVARGTLLAEVDPRDVENGYQQALADYDIAQRRHEQAVAERERTEELYRQNFVTKQDYENALLNEANQNASLIKSKTNLDLAEERRNDVTIRAPIDGTIISRAVEEGTVIQSASSSVSGGTALMTMADLSRVQVRALIDETDLGRLRVGQEAQLTVDAYPNRVFVGAVTKIEPLAVVDQNVTMFPVIIELDNSERLLKPGMNSSIVFEIAQRTDVLAVPNAAVINEDDAVVAGELLGLTEEQVQTALAQSRGNAVRVAQNDQPPADAATDASAPGALGDQTAAGSTGDQTAAGADDQMAGGAATRTANGSDPATQGSGDQATASARGDGPRFGRRGGDGGGRGGRGRGRGRRGNSGALDAARPAVVFVKAPDGTIAPRRITLGVNDWDYSEVVGGLEEGEQVVLMSVARIQQQREDYEQRMRDRAAGALTGRGGMGGGRRGSRD